MNSKRWRERKRSKRLGVIEQDALIAALEAAEKELDLVDTALARRQALDDCPTRYDKILRACTTASRAEKAEADRAALAAALRKAYEGGVRERWLMEGVKQLRLISSLIDVDDLTTQRYSREAMVAAKNLEGFSHPSLPADVAELLARCEGRKEEVHDESK